MLNVVANPDYDVVLRGVVIFQVSSIVSLLNKMTKVELAYRGLKADVDFAK